MGFNKLLLPELKQLKEQLLREGNEAFIQHWVRRYSKSDVIIGPVDSMEFIKQLIEREYESGEIEST